MLEESTPTPSRRGRPGRQPTMADVARAAGVSTMTVSRVLNDTQAVSPEARKRVARSVQKLGYRRNENARSLRQGQRTGLIGVVVTNLENPYYAQVLSGIEEGLDSAGLRALVGMSHGELAREARLVADFTGRQVDGLVVVPAGSPAPHLHPEQLRSTPLVLASRANDEIAADTVVIDDLSGARQGTLQLLEHGCRRIAFLGNATAVSTSQRRFEGFRTAMTEAGIEIDPALVDRSCRDAASSRAAIERLLSSAPYPDAVFAANNQVTVGILGSLMSHAASGGAAIPIAALDDFALSEVVTHPLVLVDHDARGLGRTAARLMLQRLAVGGNDTPPLAVALPTTVRLRLS